MAINIVIDSNFQTFVFSKAFNSIEISLKGVNFELKCYVT